MNVYCNVVDIEKYQLGKVVALCNINTDIEPAIIWKLKDYKNTKTVLGHIIGFGQDDKGDDITIEVKWCDGETTFVPPESLLFL
jgi:hypothetical protein